VQAVVDACYDCTGVLTLKMRTGWTLTIARLAAGAGV
jgi:hypothetical protein